MLLDRCASAGCAQSCETLTTTAVCSCAPGFILLSDDKVTKASCLCVVIAAQSRASLPYALPIGANKRSLTIGEL